MNLDSAVLYSHDPAKAAKFYQDLGLELVSLQEHKFASLRFENEVLLSIKQASEPRENPGCQTIFINTQDISEVFAKAQAGNLNIRNPLEAKPWGQEFSLWDPDHNKVVFIQRT